MMTHFDKSPRASAPRLAALLLALILFPASLSAQTGPTAGVRGTVSDQSGGGRIAGARVVVRNAALGVERTTAADGERRRFRRGRAPGVEAGGRRIAQLEFCA
jgi:hypothetical protein